MSQTNPTIDHKQSMLSLPAKTFNEWEDVLFCDLCGSADLVWLNETSHIKQCERCSHVLLSPRPTLKEIANAYSSESAYSDWIVGESGRDLLWQKRLQRISPFVPPGSKVLDYSAGIGTFLSLLRKKGCLVHGTELSESAKKIALEKYDIPLCDESEISVARYESYFDAITAWHVLEHVESPAALISWFWKLLTPAGILIIAVPNREHTPIKNLFLGRSYPLEKRYPVLHPGDEIHLSYFSKATLSTLLRNAGFNVQEISIDDHFANPSIRTSLKYWFYTTIEKIFRKNLSETIFVRACKMDTSWVLTARRAPCETSPC
jgi:2-polyprenyl-3-methyl-5-hydroxy-6-metoxy-1,4-benzoquinol methylase